MNTVAILSIDGGGIRGIIPAIILQEIQRRLHNKGVCRGFHNIFELIAGTSTGGLIALSLTVPINGSSDDIYSLYGGVKLSEIVKLYETLGRKIFNGDNRNVLTSARQFYTCKYKEFALEQLLENIFRNKKTKEALTNILITSFDMSYMTPVFIKKRPLERGGREDINFYMKDAARATSAAPTYFSPAQVRSLTFPHEEFCLVDGGVFCGNPSLSAYIEAKKIFPEAEKFIIISLGTGNARGSYSCREIKKWGAFGWASPWNRIPILEAVTEGQKISAQHMLKKLPGVELFRFDTRLEPGKGAMDDGSADNIRYLKKVAYDIIGDNDEQLERLCAILKTKSLM